MSLRNRKWLHFRILSPFRYLFRKIASQRIPKYLSEPVQKTPKTQEGIIVSFTSFPARIGNVWQVVECMLRQSILPEKIILWLSKEQFPNEDSIPQSLKERENEIFQVRLVEGDIRSHKKYYYVATEFKDKLVFLIDDDIYYPTDILEKSLATYNKNPHSVVCNFSHLIRYDKNGKHLPYSQWGDNNDNIIGSEVFLGTGGGTLLRFLDLYEDVTNLDLALSLTPIADDIWINTMIRLANLKIITISKCYFLPIGNNLNDGLWSTNVCESRNDQQLTAIEAKYGHIFDKNP